MNKVKNSKNLFIGQILKFKRVFHHELKTHEVLMQFNLSFLSDYSKWNKKEIQK